MADRHSGISWLVVAAAGLLGAVFLVATPAGAAATPKAELSINPAEGSLAVTFTAASTGFPAAVVSYEWSFGDGGKAVTSGHVVTHRYPSAGEFTPSVTEVDASGNAASAKGTIRLFECPVGEQDCTASLGKSGPVQELKVGGPVGPKTAASVNLFDAPFKIPQCQLEIVPTVAFTDSGFTGNLTVTLVYTTTLPNQAKTTCFASTVPFVDAGGTKVTSGTLPACRAVKAPPCVESTEISGTAVSKVLLVPPGDPKVGAP